jgi:hypothetical protein
VGAYDGLTPRQRAFVDHYLMMSNDVIQLAIEERRKPLERARLMDAQRVLERFSEEAENCDFPPSRLKALEVLAKFHRILLTPEEQELRLRLLRAQVEAAELDLRQAQRLAGEGDTDPAEGYWNPAREVDAPNPDPQATGGDPGDLPQR